MNLLKICMEKVYRACRFVYLFFGSVLFSCLLPAPLLSSQVDEAYLAELISRARNMQLHEDRYWEILLQYKQAGSGKKSLVDDPKFFLAHDGKTNPEAELAATISSFFRAGIEGQEHPRCRFAARYQWLKERLFIDESKLAEADCTRLNEALEAMKPAAAALVFPASYINSPASMFGHTLIRIDSGSRSELLSHATNYAAVTTDRNAFVYSFKGLFGYYHGYYSNLPYYEKVAEYSDIERRDIWEYELNLTEEEVRRMAYYIWELKDVYSYYYFLDENCSYNILFLIEAARPSLRLTDAVGKWPKWWVIPADTVRALRDSGAVASVKYRPSKMTRILFMSSQLDDELQSAVLRIVSGRSEPSAVLDFERTPEEKMRALDLASEVLQYRYSRGQINKDIYLKRFLDVLRVRSSLGKGEPYLDAIPVPPAPHDGHLPGRAEFGGGFNSTSWFTEIGFRPAYHDLMDPDEGYIFGSQINFLKTRLRYYHGENALRLQSLRFIDIVSLTARSKFYKPISWKVNTGIERKLLEDGKEHLIYRVNPGGGVAYKLGADGLIYSMMETDLNIGGAFAKDYSIGFGGSAGLLKSITSRWKVHAFLRGLFYDIGDKHASYQASLFQNFKLTTGSSIEAGISREKTFEEYRSEVRLSWNIYF